MEISGPVLASGKLLVIFGLLVLMIRMRVALWLTILAACLVMALMTGIMPASWPGIVWGVLTDQSFVVLCLMIWLIIFLSSVQDAAGQNRKLVRGLERYIKSPRIRLVLFPALVGLLPMPGGALFSCPMIKAAARDMGVSNEKKTLINYWFRHIWELAWPLYPGYALTCTLLDIPITSLWRFTFPLVLIAFATGWFFFMRDLARSPLLRQGAGRDSAGEDGPGESLGAALLHALPIGVTLIGAGVFGFLFDRFFPELPGQIAFSLSLALAIGVAYYQGRAEMKTPLLRLTFSRNVGRILLLLAAVYLFKEVIALGGLVRELGDLGAGPFMVLPACFLIPFISGLLTGILVGLVGVALPIILGLIDHSAMQAYLAPLAVLTLVTGNGGQLLSPVHVCLVVTCEFFTTPLAGAWRALLVPTAVLMAGGALLALALALLGVSF
ncbi:MAG: DUF401 family protein [Desulfovibrio sp.]|jgi:integral membrane protein (TIGR00529 family)|nr:DUF401 family protein [Desulfovibrio sp.]